MNQIRVFLVALIGIGLVLLGVGLYLAFKPETAPNNSVSTVTQPIATATSSQQCKTGIIPVNQPFTNVGKYQGKVTISISGTATIDSTREDFGPRGWIAGGAAPKFFTLPGSPMFSAIALINGKYRFVGESIELNLTQPTTIELGPNEGEEDGLGYKDNKGSWNYEVCSVETQRNSAKEINVPMNVDWTDTGISVSDGQDIEISATGKGVWKNISKNNPNATPNAYEECGPDGTAPNSPDYLSNIHQYQTRLANKGALIGRIGEYGVPFKIGSKLRMKLTESGRLFLGINDMKQEVDSTSYSDNTGGFKAILTIE